MGVFMKTSKGDAVLELPVQLRLYGALHTVEKAWAGTSWKLLCFGTWCAVFVSNATTAVNSGACLLYPKIMFLDLAAQLINAAGRLWYALSTPEHDQSKPGVIDGLPLCRLFLFETLGHCGACATMVLLLPFRYTCFIGAVLCFDILFMCFGLLVCAGKGETQAEGLVRVLKFWQLALPFMSGTIAFLVHDAGAMDTTMGPTIAILVFFRGMSMHYDPSDFMRWAWFITDSISIGAEMRMALHLADFTSVAA